MRRASSAHPALQQEEVEVEAAPAKTRTSSRSNNRSRSALPATKPQVQRVSRSQTTGTSTTARPRRVSSRAEAAKPAIVDQDDDSDDEAEEIPIPLSPPKVKVKEAQKRLGVGRPVVVGGSGARRSTAKGKAFASKSSLFIPPKDIVEVVVPSVHFIRAQERERRGKPDLVTLDPCYRCHPDYKRSFPQSNQRKTSPSILFKS